MPALPNWPELTESESAVQVASLRMKACSKHQEEKAAVDDLQFLHFISFLMRPGVKCDQKKAVHLPLPQQPPRAPLAVWPLPSA